MNPSLLAIELSFYRGHIPSLAHDMIAQTIAKKIGATKNGILYTIEGTRASGEPNTSCGNSIINATTMHFSAIRNIALSDRKDKHVAIARFNSQAKIFVLGDDNLLASPIPLDVATMRQTLAQCGIDAKFKDTDRDNAEFCSCRFWQLGPNETLIGPKPGRVIPKLGWATNMLFKNREKMYEHIRGVALGMHESVNHVPVLRAIITTILRVTKAHNVASIPDKYAFHFKNDRKMEATAYTFAQFEAVYGLPREKVLAFERRLDSVAELPHRIDDPLIDVLVARDT